MTATHEQPDDVQNETYVLDTESGAVAIVILLSTRGTAGSDIWFTRSADRPVARSYHPRDYA